MSQRSSKATESCYKPVPQSTHYTAAMEKNKASWIPGGCNFDCVQNHWQNSIFLGFKRSQSALLNLASVDEAYILNCHVTLLPFFISFIWKGLILQQQLDCCIVAKGRPKEHGATSPLLSTARLGTTHVEIFIMNTKIFCIFQLI